MFPRWLAAEEKNKELAEAEAVGASKLGIMGGILRFSPFQWISKDVKNIEKPK